MSHDTIILTVGMQLSFAFGIVIGYLIWGRK